MRKNITSWGSLDVALYYDKNIDKYKKVFNTFNENYIRSIQNVRGLFKENSIINVLPISEKVRR